MSGKISLSANILAQALHCAFGGLCVTLPGWLFASNKAALIGTACAIVFAAVKEAWFDPRYETVETAGSGFEDFAFWLAGIGAAWILRVVIG